MEAMASSCRESLEYRDITLTLTPRVGPWRVLLDRVSGRAEAGRTTALMGPSGSGKTSLIHALAGSLRSQMPARLTGSVLVNGVDRPARVSVVGQHDALYPLFTVALRRVFWVIFALARNDACDS